MGKLDLDNILTWGIGPRVGDLCAFRFRTLILTGGARESVLDLVRCAGGAEQVQDAEDGEPDHAAAVFEFFDGAQPRNSHAERAQSALRRHNAFHCVGAAQEQASRFGFVSYISLCRN